MIGTYTAVKSDFTTDISRNFLNVTVKNVINF